MKITGADYADDLAVQADVLKDATFLQHSIKRTVRETGLYLNADKTEFIYFNQDASEGMKSLNSEKIKQVEEFKYLGGYIASTEHDVNIRLGKAWDALNELGKIWKSNPPDDLKRNVFRAAVETVLLYGSVSWTLTIHLEKKIDGASTRMLRTALNRSWKDHPINEELHGHIPLISKSLQQQRMRLAGHCWRSKEELAGDVLIWKPTQRHQPRGRPKKTKIDQLMDDTGCRLEELPIAMEDKEGWKECVMEYRGSST